MAIERCQQVAGVFSHQTAVNGTGCPKFSAHSDINLHHRVNRKNRGQLGHFNLRVVSGRSLPFLLKERAAVKETRASPSGVLKASLQTHRDTVKVKLSGGTSDELVVKKGGYHT